MNVDTAWSQVQRAIDAGDLASIEGLLTNTFPWTGTTKKSASHAPLAWAAHRGRLDLIALFLEHGANAAHDARSEGSRSYLAHHLAVASGEDAAVDALLAAGAPTDITIAIHRNDADLARHTVLADTGALTRGLGHMGFTPLHLAADLDRAEMAHALIELGASTDAEDPSGHAPLYYAARNEPALATCEVLAEHGADLDHASRTGITALTAACRHEESMETVRWLLAHGANPNHTTSKGTTALHKAASNRQWAMLELLVAAGGNAHLPDSSKTTAADIAVRKGLDPTSDLIAT